MPHPAVNGPRLFPAVLTALAAACLLAMAGAALAQSAPGGRNLLDSGRDSKANSLQNALETFMLDRIGPAGDVVALMKAAPSIIRVAKVLQLKRRRTEAYQNGQYDRAERINALLECWQFGNCAKARRIQAAARAKYQTAPPPRIQPPRIQPPRIKPPRIKPPRKQLPGSPCRPGRTYCPRGANGNGGCITPQQICIKGLVCWRGSYFCKLPGEPAYCARPGERCRSRLKKQAPPPQTIPQPRPQPRCRLPQRWCPAGAYGPGRCYLPGAQRCGQGMVCPAGFKPCKRPGQRASCIPGGQSCRPVHAPALSRFHQTGASRAHNPASSGALAPPRPAVTQPVSRCRPPQRWCPPGIHGPGRCFLPGAQRCAGGLVCPAGFRVCRIAGQRPRCIPANGLCLSPQRPQANTPLQNFHRTAPSSRHQPATSRARPAGTATGGRCAPPRRLCAPGRFGRGGCFAPARQSCGQGMICPRGMRPCKPRGEAARCIPGRAFCLPRTGIPAGKPKPNPKPKPPVKAPGGVHDSFGSKFGSKTFRSR